MKMDWRTPIPHKGAKATIVHALFGEFTLNTHDYKERLIFRIVGVKRMLVSNDIECFAEIKEGTVKGVVKVHHDPRISSDIIYVTIERGAEPLLLSDIETVKHEEKWR